MDQNVAGTELVGDGSPARISPWWLIRCGRGRVGGSTFLNFAIEWGRHRGRRVKPLDGDLRSRTLTALYPAIKGDGTPDADAAVSPSSEELIDNKVWFTAELDASVEDGVCRAIDGRVSRDIPSRGARAGAARCAAPCKGGVDPRRGRKKQSKHKAGKAHQTACVAVTRGPQLMLPCFD